MLMPSIFRENLFDDWFDFPDFRDLDRTERKLYGRHADRLMKTDVHEHEDHYEVDIDLPGFAKDEITIELKDGYLKSAGVPEGFIILKANNQNIRSAADMDSVFKSAQASDEQTLWIWGKTPAGRPMSFAVYLGE